MAVEKLFFAIKQDYMIKAAGHSMESTKLLMEGRRDEAEAEMNAARTEIEKTRRVDGILLNVLNSLQEAGISQPPIEFLQGVVARELARPLTSEDSSQAAEPAVEQTNQNTQETLISTEKKPFTTVKFFEDEKIQESSDTEQTVPAYLQLFGRNQVPQVQTEAIPAIKSGEKRKTSDLGERQEKLAYSTFALNEDRSDFAYPTWDDVWRKAYEEELAALPDDKERKRKGSAWKVHSERSVDGLLAKLAISLNPSPEAYPYLAKFCQWLTSQPEYADLSVEDLTKIAYREISLDEVKQLHKEAIQADVAATTPVPTEFIEDHEQDDEKIGTVPVPDQTLEIEQAYEAVTQAVSHSPVPEIEKPSPRLSPREIHVLASTITSSDAKKLADLGAKLHPDDIEELNDIIFRSKEEAEKEGETDLDVQALAQKLLAHVEDRRNTFVANAGNEDAQFLLTVLTPFDSVDKISALLKNLPGGKKNNA